MRKVLVIAALVLLVWFGGRAAGGGTAEATGLAAEDGGPAGPDARAWLLILVFLAAWLAFRWVRRSRRGHRYARRRSWWRWIS